MSYPPRSICKTFAALPWTPGDARTFTGRVLAAWDLPDLTFAAELLVSELITNAVRHAGGVVDPPDDLDQLAGNVPRVLLCLSVLDALLIEVWDQSSILPEPREADDDDDGGRGLELVAALSKEWGARVLDTGGKIVSAALDLDGE